MTAQGLYAKNLATATTRQGQGSLIPAKIEEGPPCFSGLNEVIEQLEKEVEVNWKDNAFITPSTTSSSSAAENKKYKRVVGNRIFYLALPPVVYPSVCAEIKASAMSSTASTSPSLASDSSTRPPVPVA